MAVEISREEFEENFYPQHEHVHLKIGDSAASMRALCHLTLTDRCWTLNPNEVCCPRCLVYCR